MGKGVPLSKTRKSKSSYGPAEPVTQIIYPWSIADKIHKCRGFATMPRGEV